MNTDEILVKDALNCATGASVHRVSSWVFKYRVAAQLGDETGAETAEQNLRALLATCQPAPRSRSA